MKNKKIYLFLFCYLVTGDCPDRWTLVKNCIYDICKYGDGNVCQQKCCPLKDGLFFIKNQIRFSMFGATDNPTAINFKVD